MTTPWVPGEVIARREVLHGHLWLEHPVTVVDDDGTTFAVLLEPGSPFGYLAYVAGSDPIGSRDMTVGEDGAVPGALGIMTGTDLFAVEGTSAGEHAEGTWRAGVTHAGRWCDVFEVRDFLIQRCFIYLDPDYGGRDTSRYPWLSADGRDPSKPMG